MPIPNFGMSISKRRSKAPTRWSAIWAGTCPPGGGHPQGGHQQQPDNIRKSRHGEIQVEGLQGQQDQNHGTSLSGIYPQVHAAYTPQRFLQDKVLWDHVIGEQQNRNGGLFQVTESNKVHLLLRRSVHL